MIRFTHLWFVFLVGVFLIAGIQKGICQTPPPLSNPNDKLAYSIGLAVGAQLKAQGVELGTVVNPQVLLAGIVDSATGAKPRLSEAEIKQALETHRKAFEAKQAERLKAMKEKNAREAAGFLAQNKNQPGVQTTPSGLQYRVITPGTGKTPKPTDTVIVHYKGTLLNGKEFDNSYKRGQPVTFPIKGMIPGWSESLQMMKEGAKYQLFIAPALAYGEAGFGPDIEPNSLLIFEVELISVKPAQ